jgi:hypothetical protein
VVAGKGRSNGVHTPAQKSLINVIWILLFFQCPIINDWSKWFAISSPHLLAVPISVLWLGLQKSTELNLDVKNIFAGVTYQALLEMMLLSPVKAYLCYIRLIGLRRLTTDFLRTQLFSKRGVGLGYHLILIPLFPERSQPLPP